MEAISKQPFVKNLLVSSRWANYHFENEANVRLAEIRFFVRIRSERRLSALSDHVGFWPKADFDQWPEILHCVLPNRSFGEPKLCPQCS